MEPRLKWPTVIWLIVIIRWTPCPIDRLSSTIQLQMLLLLLLLLPLYILHVSG